MCNTLARDLLGSFGCFDDKHLPGLTRLATDLRSHDTIAILQLHHAGRRSPADLVGQAPVCPSEDTATGARALSTDEVEELRESFIAAAVRCEQAGFEGVELHGAHDYVICQFLSPETNRRTDQYGGSLENRSRLLFEIIDGIRLRCRPNFNLSVRLSPERFGLVTSEIVDVYARLVDTGVIDFIDMSLWDVFKTGIAPDFQDKRLVDVFAALGRGSTRLGVAGKLYTAQACRNAVEAGADMMVIGRSWATDRWWRLAGETQAHVARRTVSCRTHARCGSIATAIRVVAEERTTFEQHRRVAVGTQVPSRHRERIGCPLPHIADHVVHAKNVRHVRINWARCVPAVCCGVAVRKRSLKYVHPVVAIGFTLVPPWPDRCGSSTSRELPLGFGRKARTAPLREGQRVGVADMDHRMMLTVANIAVRTFWRLPGRSEHLTPPLGSRHSTGL